MLDFFLSLIVSSTNLLILLTIFKGILNFPIGGPKGLYKSKFSGCVHTRFLTLEPTIQNCTPEICDPETKIIEDSEGKSMLGIQDWNKALEQLKLDLWVSLQSLMDESQISGQSRDSVLALNEEVIGLPLSSELRNKLLSQPLE